MGAELPDLPSQAQRTKEKPLGIRRGFGGDTWMKMRSPGLEPGMGDGCAMKDTSGTAGSSRTYIKVYRAVAMHWSWIPEFDHCAENVAVLSQRILKYLGVKKQDVSSYSLTIQEETLCIYQGREGANKANVAKCNESKHRLWGALCAMPATFLHVRIG